MQDTATRIDQMQTAIADMERRLDQITVTDKDRATVARLREDIQGLFRHVRDAE